MTSTQENGNEIVTVAAHYSADVFTDHGGVPGTFVGHLILPGTAEFTYVGRDPSVNPLGTFATDLTEFDFKGMLNGKTFEIKQNSVKESSGETTILEVTSVPPIEYAVSGSLNLFGEFSFNGRPFVPGPGRMATLTAIPEPQTGALADLILVGVLGIASRRRVRAKTHSVTPIKSNGL